MANKLVVFVIFAAVIEASLASVNIQAAKKITVQSWTEAIGIIYNTLANPSNLEHSKAEYIAVRAKGSKAYFEAANANQGQQNEGAGRSKSVTDLIFGAIALAAKANSKDLTATNTAIDKLLNQVPVADNVKIYFTLAKSSASQTEAVAILKEVFKQFSIGIKSLAALKAGKAKSIDNASKTAAIAEVSKFLDIVFGLLLKKQ